MARIARRKLAELIADRIGSLDSRDAFVKAIAAYLIEHGATKDVEQIVNETLLVLAERKQHILATVTTAREVDPGVLSSVQAHIARQTGTQNIEIVHTTDSAIVGGMIIDTPGAAQDASVRTLLKTLARG